MFNSARPMIQLNPAQPAPSPLWVKTELAGEHYRKTCIAYGNQEASMTDPGGSSRTAPQSSVAVEEVLTGHY